MADDNTFSKISDDVVLKIFFQLEDDPRNWARLSCVSRKFSSLISTVCCKSKCISTFPSLTAEILSLSSTSASPPGGWSSLYKIAVCCPGLRHSGVLLDNSDFGLLRELGPDAYYHYNDDNDDKNSGKNECQPCVEVCVTAQPGPCEHEGQNRVVTPSGSINTPECHPRVEVGVTTQSGHCEHEGQDRVVTSNGSIGDTPEAWTLYDDLCFDTIYDNSEVTFSSSKATTTTTPMDISTTGDDEVVTSESEAKKRKVVGGTRVLRSHLASGMWNLSREQGNKLLASRFREDCLYVCDWPGCVHMEDKRNYMLFRGVFKNFKRSRVWRTINDGNRSKIDLNCAFCGCKETWDLHSSFCLKRGFGFHDDGEPVVRAYVCENGHVSGAWTDLPLYS